MTLSPDRVAMQCLLRRTLRRYRLADDCPTTSIGGTLAMAIERARLGLELPEQALSDVRTDFLNALARLITTTLANGSDPSFQAMLLRSRSDAVRQYASLAATAEQDRRLVRARITSVAHPQKLARLPVGSGKDALAALLAAANTAHALAIDSPGITTSSNAWSDVESAARHALSCADVAGESIARQTLAALLGSPELERLQRLASLADDAQVQHYRSMWSGQGPRSGSEAAASQGKAAQQRGAAVEDSAAAAVHALARALNARWTDTHYHVVTSLRTPAILSGGEHRAKGEWDVVLLRRDLSATESVAWEVCLLIEAKASPDAATSDYPRLRRGLDVLAKAEDDQTYAFACQQGTVNLSGASLRALTPGAEPGHPAVLYCSTADVESHPKLLSASSRMQLLSAPASLTFAGRLIDGLVTDPEALAQVWEDLHHASRYSTVREQLPTLNRVREMMIHPDDLLAAIGTSGVHADSRKVDVSITKRYLTSPFNMRS